MLFVDLPVPVPPTSNHRVGITQLQQSSPHTAVTCSPAPERRDRVTFSCQTSRGDEFQWQISRVGIWAGMHSWVVHCGSARYTRLRQRNDHNRGEECAVAQGTQARQAPSCQACGASDRVSRCDDMYVRPEDKPGVGRRNGQMGASGRRRSTGNCDGRVVCPSHQAARPP